MNKNRTTPVEQPAPEANRRRMLMGGLGAVGAVGAMTVARPAQAKTPAPTETAAAREAKAVGVSEHVHQYYRTTLI